MESILLDSQFLDQAIDAIDRPLICDALRDPTVALDLIVDLSALLTHTQFRTTATHPEYLFRIDARAAEWFDAMAGISREMHGAAAMETTGPFTLSLRAFRF